MEPIFSGTKEKRDSKETQSKISDPEPSENRKLRKLTKSVSSPSVKDALSGKMETSQVSAKEQHEIYHSQDYTEDFTEERFREAWNLFLSKVDSPSMKTTLSTIPEYDLDYNFVLKIDNSVQEENVKSIKPDLVAFLRKELKNSSIEISVEIVESKAKRIIYSDDEKYAEMAKKNPDLALLRQKFNLDFGE